MADENIAQRQARERAEAHKRQGEENEQMAKRHAAETNLDLSRTSSDMGVITAPTVQDNTGEGKGTNEESAVALLGKRA